MTEPYWTAFALSGVDPNELHCTHKFLGELSPVMAVTARNRIDAHFSEEPFKPFDAYFGKAALYGQDKDIRVLLPNEAIDGITELSSLRKRLDPLHLDEHQYSPHITTNQPAVIAPFNRYVLMHGKQLVAEWPRSAKTRIKELAPVRLKLGEFDSMERRIMVVFRKLLYGPLMRTMHPDSRFSNAQRKRTALESAIGSGHIAYKDGVFSGRFNSATSKELRSLGAFFDKHTGTYLLNLSKAPDEIQLAVKSSETRFKERIKRVKSKLRQNLPEEIAEAIKTSDLIDSTLWRVDRSVIKTLKGITVLPQVSPEARKKIADEWQNNMDLWIKDFTEKQIVSLRQQIALHVASGNRFEDIVRTIRTSYGVTEKKAKFLARQETSLLMTKFKETRYTEAGSVEYRWTCVAGSPLHPVRPSHKILDGKIFRWDDPPITTAPDESQRRNNPGQDYNCRCAAKPIVRF